VLHELGAHVRTKEIANSRVLLKCVLRRRSTSGPTARETFPPPAPGQINVWYRDIALDARGVGNGLRSRLLIGFDGAAIARSKPVAVLRLWGRPMVADPFLTQVTDADGIVNALANLVNTRWRGLVDSEIRLHIAYTAKDWRLPAELLQKRAPDDRPDTGPTLIVTLLLSLPLWAGIWGVVGSLAAIVLR
jgi:hypothetical protein